MEDLYDVHWSRVDDTHYNGVEDMQVCHGLTLRTALARLKGAIRNSGAVVVHKVVRSGRGEEDLHDVALDALETLMEAMRQMEFDTIGGAVKVSSMFERYHDAAHQSITHHRMVENMRKAKLKR